MNKYLPLVIIVLLLMVGGGIFLSVRNKSSQPGVNNTGQDQSRNGNTFDSIKDALTKSLSLECVYKDERGLETTTYIKGGAVRADSRLINNGLETMSHTIFSDNKMYTWDPAKKQGVLMNVPEETMEEARSLEISPPGRSSGSNQGENFLAEIEKYKDACKPATVDDSLFTPPTDVDFQDLSSMFQNIPSGAVPSGFNFEDFQEQTSPPE